MGRARWNQVPECKRGEAAGLGLLFVHTTSAELQGKGYRMFIFFIQIYKTSLLPELQDRDLGEQNNSLENTLVLKAFEDKKATGWGGCLEIGR